jgi:hypothetical protein
VRNPLESEEMAFRYVLGTLAYFVPIAFAAWIATWLGVVVFIVMTIAAIFVIVGGRKPQVPQEPPPPAAVEDTPVPPASGADEKPD